MKLILLLYADDTIIMSTTKERRQNALNYMCEYCKKWKLEINSEKTKVTMFGYRKVNITKLNFLCNGQRIELVPCFKYLGLLFNYNGSFKNALVELHAQATRAMFAVIARCRKYDL